MRRRTFITGLGSAAASTGMLTGMTIALVLTWSTVTMFAQVPETDSVKDRIEIQEKLLYAYAYTWDAKDCIGWSNLFTTDAVLELRSIKGHGRDAIREACTAQQKNVLGNTKTRHNVMNIVFDQLTPSRAETRTYVILTLQKPDDQTITIRPTRTYKDVIIRSNDGRWLFKERKTID